MFLPFAQSYFYHREMPAKSRDILSTFPSNICVSASVCVQWNKWDDIMLYSFLPLHWVAHPFMIRTPDSILVHLRTS